MGIAFGLVSYLWLGFIFNDTVIEITLTLAVSYLAYFTVCNLLYLLFDMIIGSSIIGKIIDLAILQSCTCYAAVNG